MKPTLLLWFFGVLVAISDSKEVHSHYIGDKKHEGIYSRDIQGGQIVIPRKVDHYGVHISHDLDHYHDEQTESAHAMDIENGRKPLHYHLELNNETLHIELEPSHADFIAPHMIIERHRRDTRTRIKYADQRKKTGNGTACHYNGYVRGQSRSKVALSACKGIAGYIATKDGFYWIEPSSSLKAKKRHNLELGQPHVVFQATQNDVISATRMPRKTRKKQHNRRNRRKVSTCGTKEPKKSETRIEWQRQGQVIVQGGRKTKHKRYGGGGRHRRLSPDHGKAAAGHSGRRRDRVRRSVSTPHHVEVLLVADWSMNQFHEDGDINTYLLTIMNMVSSLYKDPSIGNLVHIVVVKIIVLDEEEAEGNLNVTHRAEETLSNFCRWQRGLNPEHDSDPYHHDVAILVTRKDICSNNGCMTLGVANVGGMCRLDRSCSVNEDNGITLAHTITHELGHNFGMYHDTEKTGCGHRIGPILHVMTPSFESDTTHVSWSNCSRRDITHFLDQGLGSCLDDAPDMEIERNYEYPDLPPGTIYKADVQCRHQFNVTDENVTVCSKLEEICSQLWCYVDGGCVTQLRAAAPGTSCGKHKWCSEQKCVPMEDKPKPVDGGWGNWTDWSGCSRTCGAGVAIKIRECDNPAPASGGSFCIGERTRYKTCNTEPCPLEEPTFRAMQCAKFNNKTFREKSYKWLPYFDTLQPCKLYCTDTGDTVIVPWGDAIDGTPCNIGTNDMCISGICKTVGCDWIVESNATEDQCGVCGGDSSTCHVFSGEINKKLNITEGYYPIVTIPKGSRHIIFEETGPYKNYLSIGRVEANVFYLNGERSIVLSGEYEIAGARGLYERTDNDKESLKVPGPILEDIILYVLMKGNHKNVGLRYEYTLSSNATQADPVYSWKLGDWTACSKTCGGGLQHRIPVCYQKGIVDEDLCWANAKNRRPTQIQQQCNDVVCPAHWWIGPWQLCPVTCKTRGTPDPIQRRSIMCVDHKDDPIADSRCQDLERPVDTKPCSTVVPYCDYDDDDESGMRRRHYHHHNGGSGVMEIDKDNLVIV